MSLGEQAYTMTRRMIITSQLEPGRKISEPELSAALGLSTASARSALARLSQEGLVSAVPRKGYTISPLTIDGAREILEVRMTLEPRAAYMATGRISAREVKQFRACFTGYKPGVEASITAALAWNSEFRKMMARNSGNTRLAALISNIVDESERYLRLSWETENRTDDLLLGYDQLATALVEGPPERAQQAVIEGLGRTERQVMASLMARREITNAPLVHSTRTTREMA